MIAAPRKGACYVCGLPAKDRCGRCKTAAYCGRQHQQLHWNRGHKGVCGREEATPLPLPDAVAAGAAFPDFLVVCEHEPDEGERAVMASSSLPPAMLETAGGDGDAAALVGDLEQEAGDAAGVDVTAVEFNARTSCEPEQCFR